MTFAEIADRLSPQDQIGVLGRFTDWAITEVTRRETARRVEMGWPVSEASAYAMAITTYLALAVGKLADRGSTLTTWNATNNGVRAAFARQAVPVVWDYAEVNPFGPQGWDAVLETMCKALEGLAHGQLSGDADIDRAGMRAIRETTAIQRRIEQMGLPL